ncbi:hypothetical protein MBLNU457_7169t2 [Dothideomycetes sp. NU457]
MTLCALLLLICTSIVQIAANTEKVIFSAPELTSLSESGPSLGALNLRTLSPSGTQLRTTIPVTFGDTVNSQGNQSWYILSNLTPNKRYEVRVCWAATQPTEFDLEIYTLSQVFDTPSLIQDLAEYSEIRRVRFPHQGDIGDQATLETTPQSVLLLRIWAAADFFSLDSDLMKYPPAVKVDIILDPYLLNIFPASLLPTGGYILAIAFISWFVSGAFWSWLQYSPPASKQHGD